MDIYCSFIKKAGLTNIILSKESLNKTLEGVSISMTKKDFAMAFRL